MKTLVFFYLNFQIIFLLSQNPFELYVEKDESWYPTIFKLYIQQYANIEVNKYLLEENDLSSIKNELNDYTEKITKDINNAIEYKNNGYKVFFFVDNLLWGGIDDGTIYSGQWLKLMPQGSGFYIYKKRCFQNEGLNFHIRPQDSIQLEFYIIKKK
mgnify:CR=1 FL=1